jgi:hypothetical protein
VTPGISVNLGLAIAALIWATVAPGTGASYLAAACLGFALGCTQRRQDR